MRVSLPIFTALAQLAMAGRLGAGLVGEPFFTQNPSPISRLYGLPSGDDAASMVPTGFQVRAAFDIANLSADEFQGSDGLVLDGETRVARLAVRHGWKNGWRVSVQVPYVSHRGGVTDSFIEEYHDALGLPQGNRKRRPPDRLEYRYQRDGEARFGVLEPADGLGDVRFSISAPLWRDGAGTRAVDAVAGVELPTGDSASLLGSGSTDFSFGLAACDRKSLSGWNLELHGSAGVLAMTEGDLLKGSQEPMAGYGNLSVGWRWVDWLMPRLQLDWHSPIFSDVEMAPLDDWAAELVAGATVRLPAGFELDVAVAEDIVLRTTPDVVFHFCLKRSL